jgi:tetratricopeptide (TPR) repeat protein
MRMKRPSIARIVRMIVLVAVSIGLWLGGMDLRWIMCYWILVVGVWVVGILWFVIAPRISLRLALGDRDRQRRILGWIVNTPFPGAAKILARYMLAHSLQVAKRYEEAESLYRAILRDQGRHPEPGLESQVRHGLADTVDALGRREEAQFEREQAATVLRGTKDTLISLQAQGKLLDRENRYAEAYTAYDRALALASPDNKLVRAELMMQITMSAFNAGQQADCLRWAEATLELGPPDPLKEVARQMAAVACSSIGRLDDAERHAKFAAQAARTPEARAAALGLLADYMLRRGDLDGGARVASEAEELIPGKKHLPSLLMGSIAKERGDHAEALRAYERAASVLEGHVPALKRRANASIQKLVAHMQAELGHADLAHAALDQAEAEFAGDPKQMATFNAMAALVHALLNEPDAARERIAAAEEARGAMPTDVSLQKSVLYYVGRAAFLIGAIDQAEQLLRAYLEFNPDPIYHSCAQYHLGESRRLKGDTAGARELYARASSTHFGSNWEALARARLAELDAGHLLTA